MIRPFRTRPLGRSSARPRPAHVVRAAAATVLALGGWASSGIAPAGAQTPTLGVSPAVLPIGRPSTVTVLGSNYLVPPHATGKNVFGGVYVFFGWVAPGGSWGPSHRNGVDTNGQYGITYSYAGVNRGADTRDDGTGQNRFVSFTSGGISGESTEFHMSMDPSAPDNSRGSWATTITISSHLYQWVDPATGAGATVDCTKVQCGIYTIGAHGVASGTNERFTPVTFAADAPVTAAPSVTVAPSGGSAASGGGSAGGSAGSTPTTAAPAGGSAAVGGSSTRRTTTTVAGSSPVATAAPDAAGAEAGETTTAPPESTVAPSSTTTAVPRSTTTGDTDGSTAAAAAGRVIVLDDPDDDGPPVAVWVAGAGVPAVGAAAAVRWRRRRAAHT